MSPPPTIHRSRTALTCDRLRRAILEARFAPGERLGIEPLCRRFEASSSAVREALSTLSAEGLVTAQPQRGFSVAAVSRTELVDLTEVRVSVEGVCLAASVEHGDVAWEAALMSVHHRLSPLTAALVRPESDDAKAWHALHEQFHATLVQACPNRWWLKLRDQLYVQSERYRRLSAPSVEGRHRDVRAEHDELAAATLARDAPAATRAMEAHLRLTTELLLGSDLPFSEA